MVLSANYKSYHPFSCHHMNRAVTHSAVLIILIVYSQATMHNVAVMKLGATWSFACARMKSQHVWSSSPSVEMEGRGQTDISSMGTSYQFNPKSLTMSVWPMQTVQRTANQPSVPRFEDWTAHLWLTVLKCLANWLCSLHEWRHSWRHTLASSEG